MKTTPTAQAEETSPNREAQVVWPESGSTEEERDEMDRRYGLQYDD